MKKLLVFGVIVLFLLLAFAPSINANISKSIISSISSNSMSRTSPIYPPQSGLVYIVPPIVNWFKYGEYIPKYEMIENWGNKPFPHPIIMFIGSGIGFRPYMNVTIMVSAQRPNHPSEVDVYSDGKYYDTIYPRHLGPISIAYYKLFYYEKGFHTLMFIASDNSSSVDVDVQVGFRGFIKHILPYLIN